MNNSAEMAKFLGVSQFTLRRWAKTGRVPCLRASPRGKLLFDLRQVQAALATPRTENGTNANSR